jgi:hypothetical protein
MLSSAEIVLHKIWLGNRSRRAAGWLVVHAGAVSGILSLENEGEVMLAAACDRRIQADHPPVFRDLPEAQAWLARRLVPQRPSGRRSRAGETHSP